jgi:hypothetical protein
VVGLIRRGESRSFVYVQPRSAIARTVIPSTPLDATGSPAAHDRARPLPTTPSTGCSMTRTAKADPTGTQSASASSENAAGLVDIDRKTPLVAPADVSLNAAGTAWRSWFVRLPEGFVADDIKEPEAWAKVQAVPQKALQKLDFVVLVAADESFVAEAWVAHADGLKAVLSKPRLTAMPERYERLFSDGTYRVVFVGGGYAVERIRDGHRMTPAFATAAVATLELSRLYPTRAA